MLSDKVPYFILDLLQQTPAVNVKGLGRFEAIFHPAVVDVPGARIKPPYIQPGFNEQDMDEDSILPAFIQYARGVDKASAEKAIQEFVSAVRDGVAANDHYTIDQFGSFSKQASGGMRFTPDWDAFNLSFTGLETLSLKEELKDSAAFTYKPLQPVQEEIIHAETKAASKPEPEEEEKVIGRPEIIPVEHRPLAAIDETTSKLWWMILGSALFLILVLCAYLAWDILSNRTRLNELVANTPDTTLYNVPQTTNPLPADTHATTVEKPIPTVTDTPIAETPAKAPEVKQPEVKESENPPITNPTTNPDRSFCYVVVGAFRDPKNVVRMVDRLKTMGYDSEQIDGGHLNKVAIKTNCDQANLQKVLSDAKSNINPEAWIY